jgi:hypothetical protein
MVVLAAAAHPPLLVLGGLLLWKIFSGGKSPAKSIGRSAAVGLLLIAGYLAVQIIITSAYTFHSHHAGDHGIMHHLRFSHEVIKSYASISHFNLHEAGNVAMAQSFYSLFGNGQGFVWNKGWGGLPAYFATPAGAVCALCFLFICASALLAMQRNRHLLMLAASCSAMVLLPYLAFFIYFNPSEMLLYCAPLELLCVIGIGRAFEISFPTRAPLLLIFIATLVAANNTVALVSYH